MPIVSKGAEVLPQNAHSCTAGHPNLDPYDVPKVRVNGSVNLKAPETKLEVAIYGPQVIGSRNEVLAPKALELISRRVIPSGTSIRMAENKRSPKAQDHDHLATCTITVI